MRAPASLRVYRWLFDIAIRVPAGHLAELWQDVHYGVRMLAASPGFTLVALISLSLGICAATSAFTKLNATVFRNLPHVAHPQALVALETPVSYPNYRQYREHRELFSASFAYVAPVPFGVVPDRLPGGSARNGRSRLPPARRRAAGGPRRTRGPAICRRGNP